MTAVHTDRSPVLVALQRADQRLVRDGADPTPSDVLEAFAAAAQAQISADAPAPAPTVPEPALPQPAGSSDAAKRAASWWEQAKDLKRLWLGEEALREEAVARLEADRDEWRQRSEQLAAERDELLDENVNLADELAQVRQDCEALRRELDAATTDTGTHRHYYPWPDPAEPPQPCDCGATHPRYRIHRANPRSDAGTDRWADLFDRIRAELPGWA